MDSLTEEFEKRQPDRFTLGWWHKQFAEVLKGYRGVSHNQNRLNAEVSELHESGKALRDRCDSLEAALESAVAKIGELQGRLDNQAAFLTEIRDERKKKSA